MPGKTTVDFEAFQKVLNRPGGFRDPGEPEEYCRGFQVFDKDMTGFIGVGQLRYSMIPLPPSPSYHFTPYSSLPFPFFRSIHAVFLQSQIAVSTLSGTAILEKYALTDTNCSSYKPR